MKGLRGSLFALFSVFFAVSASAEGVVIDAAGVPTLEYAKRNSVRKLFVTSDLLEQIKHGSYSPYYSLWSTAYDQARATAMQSCWNDQGSVDSYKPAKAGIEKFPARECVETDFGRYGTEVTCQTDVTVKCSFGQFCKADHAFRGQQYDNAAYQMLNLYGKELKALKGFLLSLSVKEREMLDRGAFDEISKWLTIKLKPLAKSNFKVQCPTGHHLEVLNVESNAFVAYPSWQCLDEAGKADEERRETLARTLSYFVKQRGNAVEQMVFTVNVKQTQGNSLKGMSYWPCLFKADSLCSESAAVDLVFIFELRGATGGLSFGAKDYRAQVEDMFGKQLLRYVHTREDYAERHKDTKCSI